MPGGRPLPGRRRAPAGRRADPGGARRGRTPRRRRRVAGPGAVRQPRRGEQPAARPGAAARAALGPQVPLHGQVAAALARHPHRGHHSAGVGAVGRSAPAARRRAGDAGPPAAAHPRRADRVARGLRDPAGGAVVPSSQRRGHDDSAGLARHRPDVPAGRSHRGVAPGSGRRRRADRHRLPRRGRRVHVRAAGRLLTAPPARPVAQPGGPAHPRRPVVQPGGHPLGARDRAGRGSAVHPPDRLRAATPDLGRRPAQGPALRLAGAAWRYLRWAGWRRRVDGVDRDRPGRPHRTHLVGLPADRRARRHPQLVGGSGGGQRRAARRDHGVPAQPRDAAPRRARSGHAVRGLRRERGGARPAARRGDGPQQGARDDPGGARAAGRQRASRRRARRGDRHAARGVGRARGRPARLEPGGRTALPRLVGRRDGLAAPGLADARRVAPGPRQHLRRPGGVGGGRRVRRSSRPRFRRPTASSRCWRRGRSTTTVPRAARTWTPPRCSRTRRDRSSSRWSATRPSGRTGKPPRCAARRSCNASSCHG